MDGRGWAGGAGNLRCPPCQGNFLRSINCLGWIYDITVLTFPLSLWLSLPLYLLTVAD